MKWFVVLGFLILPLFPSFADNILKDQARIYRQEGYRLQVKGPLHRFCGVAVKGRVLKPQKRGLFSSCYDLAPEITDLDAPVTIKVGLPLSPLDWSMVIHPFEPGF